MKQTYFLYKSTNPDKKFMVKFINNATDRINTLHFGSAQYSDYTLTNNERRKELYKLRHASDNINDLSFSGCWMLGYEPALEQEDFRKINKRYGTKI